MTPAGHDPSRLNLGAIVFAGGMAGVGMWAIAIPPDVRSLATSLRHILKQFFGFTGHQIKDTNCSRGNVPRLRRLCAKNNRG